MKTIKDVFADYRAQLANLYGANEAEAITLLVVNEISALSKAQIKAFPEKELSSSKSERLTNILAELKTGKPVQYVLGKTEFYGLPFEVNPSVLIPRPETEQLVEWVLSSVGGWQPAVNREQLTVGSILDIGTGSGCIAISLKKNLPRYKVSAIDISHAALQTAKENAKLNQVDVEFTEADILSVNSLPLAARYSLIVSNPPYVTVHDKKQMHPNVTDFEPHAALFVPADDPLVFYKAIADFAAAHLATNGLLFFEINESCGKEIVSLLMDNGFKNIELREDMSGRDRMIKANFSLNQGL
jgi:release factor glutamine methyltransferase